MWEKVDLVGPWRAIRRAPMVRIVTPFVAGSLLAGVIHPSPISATASLLIMTPPVLIVLLLPTVRSSRWQRGLLLGTWFLVFGLFWQTIRLPANDPLHVSRAAEKHGWWAVRIEAVNGVTPKLVRADAQLLAHAERGLEVPVHGTIMLSLMRSDSVSTLRVGDRLWIDARMEPITRIADPGGFDRRGWAASRGITWEAFVGSDGQHLVDHPLRWTDLFVAARARIGAWLIESGLPLRERALVKALVLGERDELDSEQITSFARSGTIHVLAVSGMHVGLIFAALGSITGWWGSDRRARWIRGIVILVALWGYAGLTGASASVLRATVMFSLFTLAGMARQRTDHLNSLFVAGLVLLVWDPAMLQHLGFQLSFLAVLGIILFYRPLLAFWSPSGWVVRNLWSLAAVSVSAQLLTTPLSLYAFKAFPIWFLPANIIVVTVASFAVYGAVILLVLFKVPVLGAALTWAMTLLLRIVGWSTDLFAGLPLAYPAVRAGLLDMALLYLLVIAIGAWWLWRWRSMRWAAVFTVIALLLNWGVTAGRSNARSAFFVYDERSGFLAAMRTGRELALLASDDSLLAHPRTNLKIERHQRAQGIARVHTGTIASTPEDVITELGSTVAGGRRWRSSGFDVYFAADDALVPPTPGGRYSAVVLHDLDYIDDAGIAVLGSVAQWVVLGGGIRWRARERIRDRCAEQGIAFHDVSEQGAFILER